MNSELWRLEMTRYINEASPEINMGGNNRLIILNLQQVNKKIYEVIKT